ncbi:MAG: hypothetical protein QW050_02685, partial [Candidatus Nitrosocaldaceae archaeon]
AHTDLQAEDITVSIGWVDEPPLVNEFNHVYFKFTKNDKPFVIEPTDLQITLRYGGITKELELKPLDKLGEYGAEIIPTRTGSYSVILKGSIDGKPIDAIFPIEDVEDKSRLNFPETTSSQEVEMITSQLQSSLNQLQLNIDQAVRKTEESNKIAQDTLAALNTMQSDFDRVYNFGILSISLGAAGVIMGVISLIKRQKEY